MDPIIGAVDELGELMQSTPFTHSHISGYLPEMYKAIILFETACCCIKNRIQISSLRLPRVYDNLHNGCRGKTQSHQLRDFVCVFLGASGA